MKKVLVVGINPSAKGYNCITRVRLDRWMEECGVTYFSFVNCMEHLGKYEKQDIRYEMISDLASTYNYVVALGNFVSDALSTLRIYHFKLPHPSGLNRLLNDKQYEIEKVEQLKRYMND